MAISLGKIKTVIKTPIKKIVVPETFSLSLSFRRREKEENIFLLKEGILNLTISKVSSPRRITPVMPKIKALEEKK